MGKTKDNWCRHNKVGDLKNLALEHQDFSAFYKMMQTNRLQTRTWKFLLKVLIFDVLSLTAYSPSDDQTISNAEPNDLFLHANAV